MALNMFSHLKVRAGVCNLYIILESITLACGKQGNAKLGLKNK